MKIFMLINDLSRKVLCDT